MMKDNGSVRMQLITDLQLECVKVQNAIEHLVACRKKLEENAAQAKVQVSIDATDALDTLRSREVQLLRQIDVIESHHSNVLLLQHAKLNQLLGNIKLKLHCARHQHDVPVNSISDEDMEVVNEVNRLRSLQNPSVTFWSDMNRMVSAIQNFGMVESTGHFLNAGQDNGGSRCLPARIEEYEDSDHQLLYKTLEELAIETIGEQKVYVAFPKLSANKEDWLQRDSHMRVAETSFVGHKPNFVLPDYLVSADNAQWLKGGTKQRSSICDSIISKDRLIIDNWLRREIVQSTLRGAQSPASFTTATSTSASESIEMISHPDTIDSTFEFTWLAYPSQQAFCHNLRSLSKKESIRCCKSAAVDIENLGDVTCGTKGIHSATPIKDRHLWLASSAEQNQDKQKPLDYEELEDISDVAIDQVCCANEPCLSFSDCLCDVPCHKRNIDVVDKNRISNKHADFIEWLKSPNIETSMMKKDESNWLRRTEFFTEIEKMDISEKGENRVGKVTSDWLKNYLTSKDEISSGFSVRPDFLTYFVPSDLNDWLAS